MFYLVIEGGVEFIIGEGYTSWVDELSLCFEVFGEVIKVHAATNNYRAGERVLKGDKFY